jgi:hypothetical protein
LRIPAGIYIISDTIYLPPYTTLIGEGQEKTVIRSTAANKSLFQTCDLTSSFVNNSSTYIIFGNLTANISNVNLIGLSFEYNQYSTTKLPILRMDGVSESRIIDCKFKGQYPVGVTATTYTDNYSGIEIRSSNAYNTKDLLIQNCIFDRLAYGIYSNYNIEDVVVDSCVFRNLSKGFAGLISNNIVGNTIGPVRTKLQNNKFELIDGEGIYFGNNLSGISANNISTQNTFVEVGNALDGDVLSSTAVINFQSQGNRSIEDYFDRYRAMNADTGNNYYRRVLEGRLYQENTGVRDTAINTGTSVVTKFPIAAVNQTIKMQYTVIKPVANIYRTGELTVQTSVYNLVPSVSITDNYTYTGTTDGGIEFIYRTNTTTNTLELGYTNTGTAEGVIRYKFNQLQ